MRELSQKTKTVLNGIYMGKRISFVGDIMCGDQPVTFGYGFDSLHHASAYEGIFDGVKDCLQESAVVIGNFEGVIRPRHSSISVKNWLMCSDESVVAQLYNCNIRVLSIANNHTMDFGEDGYYHTKDVIESKLISVIGDAARPWTIVDVDDIPVGIVSASYVNTPIKYPRYFYKPTQADWIITIKNMRDAGAMKIYVYLHWGNEFTRKPNQEQIEIAWLLSTLGVDAIVGCHAHIISPALDINGIPVIFSVGNFISDYWQLRLRETIILNISLDHNMPIFDVDECIIDNRGVPLHVKRSDLCLCRKEDILPTSKLEISYERWRMRLEYILKLLTNWHRIKNRKRMIKWVFDRIYYLAFYSYQEFHNPNIIYDKYRN